MYSGELHIGNDQLQEAISASDYFQITALKHALDDTARYKVVPSNVLSWQKLAQLYTLPLTTEMCDRVLLLKLSEIKKHGEFSEMSHDELLAYLQKCAAAYDNHDVLLRAAVTWMERNQMFSAELLSAIHLEQCTESTLDDVSLNTECCKSLRSPNHKILAFVTDKAVLVKDNYGRLKKLGSYCASKGYSILWCQHFCPMENGFLWVPDDRKAAEEGKVYCSVHKFDVLTLTLTELPNSKRLKPRGMMLSAVHMNKLYIIPFLQQEIVEVYDLISHSWRQIINPRPCDGSSWKAASVGDQLYFLNDNLILLRLSTDHLEEIQTQISLGNVSGKRVSLAAVDRWLYIFVSFYSSDDSRALVGYSYNTQLNIWTKLNIHVNCNPLPCNGRSFFFENRIFLGCVTHKGPMYEYDLATDVLSTSQRIYPTDKCYCPLVINIDDLTVLGLDPPHSE